MNPPAWNFMMTFGNTLEEHTYLDKSAQGDTLLVMGMNGLVAICDALG